MSFRVLFGISLIAVHVSCRGEPGAAPALAELPDDVVASVGDDVISARQVLAAATARAIPREAARDALIRDALFAAAAWTDASGEAAHGASRVLARVMLHRLAEEAATKPIDETELSNWSMARFLDVDRPGGFRVVHAVVLVPSAAGPDLHAAAKAHAALIRTTAEGIVQEAAAVPPPARIGRDVFLERPEFEEDRISAGFRDAVETLEHGELNVRFESLGVISEDGRSLHYGKSPWDRMNDAFASAAARLTKRGDMSPVVETSLEADGKSLRGYHVIALLERTQPLTLSHADRLARLRPEILESRAREARDELLNKAHQRAAVRIERNAEALLESVQVTASPRAANQESQ